MSVSAHDAFRDAVRRLELAGVPTPQIDASALMEAACDGRSAAVDTLPDEMAADFARMVQRRVQREPVSHITQRRAFYEHEFIVTSDVLDPRPDTEALVDEARWSDFETVLDLGTGSGCILLSLLAAKPGAQGVGTDISAAALDVASRNAEKIGVADRARLVESDWFDQVDGRFDLIVSNPPYITAEAFDALQPEVKEFEPKIALTPGGDGLASYRIITAGAPDYLNAGGALMVEIGYDQGQAVSELYDQAGFTDISVLPDINGKDRVVRAVLR